MRRLTPELRRRALAVREVLDNLRFDADPGEFLEALDEEHDHDEVDLLEATVLRLEAEMHDIKQARDDMQQIWTDAVKEVA
jgi:hypothetical protein